VKLTAKTIKYIVPTFLDAAHSKKFQENWMTPRYKGKAYRSLL